MKLLNYTILFLMFLSSCAFSGKAQIPQEPDDDHEKKEQSYIHVGDSITVDTLIGDFRLFYRVSEIVDTSLVSFSCNEDASVSEIYKVDKTILLNIQNVDTTSILAYKMIDVSDFEKLIPHARDDDYVIERFYLKEVEQDSLVFGAKLCKFGKDICKDVNIFIDKKGTLSYAFVK